MLMLPELDTYGVIKEYAEHPSDHFALGAFLMLIKRAKRRINWELHDFLGSDIPYQDRVAIRLDSSQLMTRTAPSGESKMITLNDWAKMSDTEAKDAYMSLLKATGMVPDMDPDGSMNAITKDT